MATEVYDRYATSFDLDTALRIDIEDMVFQLSPYDAPFQGTYNGDYPGSGPRSILPTGSVFEVKYEWLEDELLTPRSTLSASAASGAASLDVATGEGIRFQPDDVVRAKMASGNYVQFLVTDVDEANDRLAVSVWSGTFNANIADASLIEGVGTIPVEGADPVEARATDRTRLFNYTHIWGPYPVEMSETELVVRKYGVSNEWDYQVAKRVREGAIAFEHAILYGARKLDSSARRRSMGGLDYWITTNNDSSTTSLSGSGGEAALRTLQQNCYAAGGDPRLVVVGPDQRPVISDWRKSDIRFQPTGRRRGQVVEVFESDFGVIDVMMHRWVRKENLFLFNPSQAEVCTLEGRGLAFAMLAKTGDRRQGMVVGEKGFKFRGQKHAAKMTALT